MLVYLCSQPLANEEVGNSAPCHILNNNINRCRNVAGLLVGAWAVGGEVSHDHFTCSKTYCVCTDIHALKVCNDYNSNYLHSQDFVYPTGVAYAVGGTGQEHFAVIEIHYDNPGMVSGI